MVGFLRVTDGLDAPRLNPPLPKLMPDGVAVLSVDVESVCACVNAVQHSSNRSGRSNFIRFLYVMVFVIPSATDATKLQYVSFRVRIVFGNVCVRSFEENIGGG